jgi:Ca-activated chloride channel homolog
MNGERRTTNGERLRATRSFSVRRSAFVVLVVLTSSFFVLSSSAQEQQPAFRSSSSELVVLPVVVTDKQGRYVSDLPGDRFTIFDNGRRVPIELFSNQDTPVTVGLVIDASGSMRPKIGEVLAAALRFAHLSNPEDELFALRFNDDVEMVVKDRPFIMANEIADLETAIGGIRPEGRTALYDGLMTSLDHLRSGTRTRKVLIVISDGGDNASDAKLEHVLARARDSNAAIYTVGVFDSDDMDKNPGVLKDLARTTGGERFLPRSAGELLTACEKIAREVRGGYTIGYVPPARDGAFHRVRVEIDPSVTRHLNVRTRPGYFAAGRPTQP